MKSTIMNLVAIGHWKLNSNQVESNRTDILGLFNSDSNYPKYSLTERILACRARSCVLNEGVPI